MRGLAETIQKELESMDPDHAMMKATAEVLRFQSTISTLALVALAFTISITWMALSAYDRDPLWAILFVTIAEYAIIRYIRKKLMIAAFEEIKVALSRYAKRFEEACPEGEDCQCKHTT